MNLCWIAWETTAVFATASFKQLASSLTALGFQHKQIVLPRDTHVEEKWLNDNISSETMGLILVAPSADWAGPFLTSLRRCTNSRVAFQPVAWLGSLNSPAEYERIGSLGINDVFPDKSSAEEIAGRLKLRARDAAERLRLDAERQAHAMRDAKSETTLKQREEFLSVCAHDLRSPLGLIQSCLNMILNDKTVQGTFTKLHLDLLDRARRQATTGITLVNDLLDVMAYEQGLKPQYQLLKLDDFMKEFHKDYSMQAAQKNVKFHYQNPVADWRVFFDSDRIRQLLQNLFTNALKFTDAGKNIYVSVMPFKGRRKSDPVFPMVVVTLKDEGKGIPAKDMQKIFDRFSQVKESSRAEGRGLGLTVAKQISNLHDGNIWVESKEGEGSSFFVLFPHVVSRAAGSPKPVREKNLILIADPEESRQLHAYNALKEAGLEIRFCKDGIDLLEQAFDLIPEAVLLTPALVKMGEIESANILRGDPLTSAIPIYMAGEGGAFLKREDQKLVDATLKLPIQPESAKKIADRLAAPAVPTKKAS